MIDNNIETVFEKINKSNSNSSDIVARIIEKDGKRVGYIFLESVSSDDKISDFLNKSIVKLEKKKLFESFFSLVQNSIFNSNISLCNNYEDLFYYLCSGYTAL